MASAVPIDSKLVLTFIISWPLIYWIWNVIYNISLHPLHKIPGPYLARVSRLWSRIGNMHGDKSYRIDKAHQRYGPVVRVGPNELSFSSPSAVREIYSSDAFIKEESFYRAERILHEEHIMSLRNPEAHRGRKKMLQRGFSQAAMLQFEPQVTKKIKVMLDQWAKLTNEGKNIVDVYPWAQWLAFDIIHHLLFDDDPGCVYSGKEHWTMRYMRSWRPTFIYKEFMPQLERWGLLVPGRVGNYFRDVQVWKEYALSLVQRCRTKEIRTPFIHQLLDSVDPYLSRLLTDSEVAEECMGGMFAGSGTTASTFVYLLWGVLKTPGVAKQLQKELRAAFTDKVEIPDANECAKLPFLQAVINETLRLYPAVIATRPRTAIRDTVVAGIYIPKGTNVGTQNYTIHRNTSAFPQPEAFQPERWLKNEDAAIRKEAFTPFSIGQRSCIGINLARMELNKLVAAFFLQFEAEIDGTMTNAYMKMYDQFSAGPAGRKLVLRLSNV